MKKSFSLLLLIGFLAACAAPAAEPAQVILPMVTIVPSPTFTAVPPTVALTEGFPTFTPPTVEAGKPIEICFPANGTYVDVTDNIVAGGSKTYSLNAMQGQVMSVSILPQADAASTILMQIKGADGTIFCPTVDDPQCMFWRGILPASQDYFITLAPVVDVSQFVMRVAINPPGRLFQYFQFDSDTGLSLTYPDTFAPALPMQGNYKTDPVLTLQLIETALYEKTNLSEVYLMFSSSADPQVVSTCTEPNQNGGGGPEYPVGEEVYNGLTFVHSTTEGAGAGNIYRQEIYRTVNNNTCYEIINYIHSTNIGNYPPEANVTEFDQDGVWQHLQSVLSMVKVP